jgi:precorrin-2 dehydrogenase/sirohydrochlorin ferrochelatase
MDAFPAFFSLSGRTIAIAGEGQAADAKARLFDSSPADLRRLDEAEALAPGAFAGVLLAFIV